MKLRKLIMTVVIVNLLAMGFALGAYADPKDGMNPGQAKESLQSQNEEAVVEYLMNYAANLPPGIVLNIIKDANLSPESIEELADAGVFSGMPPGIIENIYATNMDDDEDGDEIIGIITDINVVEKIIEIDDVEYELPDEIEVEMFGEEASFDDLEVGMKVKLEMDEEKAEIELIEEQVTVTTTGAAVTSDPEAQSAVMDYLLAHGSSLPPGILKNLIEDAELSEDDIEILIDAGVLSDLPKGILKEILDDDKMKDKESKYEEKVVGIITGIDVDEMLIEIDDVEYELPDNISVEIEDEDATFGDLEVGMKVKLEIDEDEAEIEVINEDEDDDEMEVEGIITGIDVDEKIIEIDGVEYELPAEIEVEIEDEDATFGDLEVGMEVELKIKNDKAKIEADMEDDEEEIEVKGIITAIDVDEKIIEIDGVEYELPSQVEVEIEDEDASLGDLEVGMEVELEIKNDKAKIEADMEDDEEEIEVKGIITAIDVDEKIIEIDGVEYELPSQVEVEIEDEDVSLGDLEIGMEVELEIKNDKAKIEVED